MHKREKQEKIGWEILFNTLYTRTNGVISINLQI